MKRVAIALIISLLGVDAVAEQPDSIEGQVLTEIVVTGTRTPKLLKDTPILTRLINRTDIRRADATDVAGLLQAELPGVEFAYAMNQQVNMNLSGFSGQNVLVLLDGERLAGETMENTDFSRLTLSGIDHIEIVRGAGSSLYGSNASGGVINIISRMPQQAWSVQADVRGGSHGLWRGSASASMRMGIVSNTLNVALDRIDTYDVCHRVYDDCDFRSVYGRRTFNIADRFTLKPVDALTVNARASYYFKERLYNPDAPDRYRDLSAGIGAKYDFTQRDNLSLNYAFDQYDKSDFIRYSGLDIRDYSNVQNTLRALYTRNTARGNVATLGGDLMRDYLLTYQFGPGETHSQLCGDLFAQYDWIISERWEAVGGLRWDYFSDGHDNHVSAKLSGRYKLGAMSLRGGYAGGFRAPTLKEKYMRYSMQDIFDIHGNSDLRAEKSQNFNISAEYLLRNYYFTLGATYSSITNHISTSTLIVAEGQRPYIEYINLNHMRVVSLEAGVRASWTCGLQASLNYCYTHEQNVGVSLTPYCPARPHALTARVSWHGNLLKGRATDVSLNGRLLSAVSYQNMKLEAPYELYRVHNPAYTLWNLRLSQDIVGGLSAVVSLENLFNYVPAVYTYNSPVTSGFTFQAGFSINLN